MAEPSLPFTIVRTLTCACVSFFSLLFASSILVVVGFLRLIVKTVLRHQHKNRFHLITPLDSIYLQEYYGNLSQMNVGFLAQAPFTHRDLDTLRKKLHENICSPHGIYQKLQFVPCVKFGFLCWDDLAQTDSFDICQHVKLCPGIESWEKVYPEDELQSRFNNLLSSPVVDESKPLWEILLIPKIRSKSSGVQSQVGVIIRMNHSYMDGISLFRFLSNCLWDEGEPGKPVILSSLGTSRDTTSNFTDLCRLYFRLFIYWPTIIIGLRLDTDENIYRNGIPNSGPMFLGSLKVKNSMLSRIRGAFNTQTTPVIISTLLSALNNIAEKKGLETPESVKITASRGLQPYPESHEPINHYILYFKRLRLYSSCDENIRQLVNINKLIHLGQEDEYEVLIYLYATKFLGFMPALAIKYLTKAVSKLSLAVSLTPLSEQVLGFQGGPITSLVSVPPVGNGIRYSLGISNYAGHFYVTVLAAKSDVIQNKHDMHDLMSELEDNINSLHGKAVETNRIKPSKL